MSLGRCCLVKTEKDKNKALFVQRLAAFILDIFIISSFASLISYPFVDANSVNNLNSSANEIIEKYNSGKIDMVTYMEEVKGVTYQLARQQGIVSLITIFLSILYFVVYQCYNKGQTVGKKLLKIKVVSSDGRELTTNNYIYRALIINSIFVDMISLAIVTLGNMDVYFYGTLLCGVLKYGLLLTCAFMVMWSKTGMGLHDRLAHTMVVKVQKWRDIRREFTEQELVRREKAIDLREKGIDPFGHRFDTTTNSKEINEIYCDKTKEDLECNEKIVVVAGRIMTKRRKGKAGFFHIQDKYGKLQIYMREDVVGEDNYDLFRKCDIGDIIGIEGTVFRTDTGEISVRAKKYIHLVKALKPLPEKFHGLTDIEERYRRRYVDLIMN